MSNQIQKLLGKRIRDIRKEKGYSQEYLAEISGFHYTYIGGVERAQTNITISNLIKIAEALNVGVYDLFTYTMLKYRGNEMPTDIEAILDLLVRLETKDVKKIRKFIFDMFEDKL
jgi:transcriptional regulator with XRE-family HTH domain